MKIGHIASWIVVFIVGFYLGSSFSSWNESIENDELEAKTEQRKPQSMSRDIAPVTVETTQERATIQLFEDSAPSVAFITTKGLQQDRYTNQILEVPAGTGSGFIWDTLGHIVTNFHVIKEGQKWEVTLSDQSIWDAELVGFESRKDLAVLKINAPLEKLKPILVGSSHDLRVGQSVYAIGNPFGLDQSLTTGIVSALGREIESIARIPIRDVIQTDAAINPGNSGGPLLDSSGRLIGVNTAIYSPSGASAGIGFSVPVDIVNWVIPDLVLYGKVQRPVLGVELVSEQNMQRWGLEGAMILDLVPGGGAEEAGLMPTMQSRQGNVRLGDIITGLEGKLIKNNYDLILALEKYKPGENVSVSVSRDGKTREVSVLLGSSL
jgi:S1-C subfamily serine protease